MRLSIFLMLAMLCLTAIPARASEKTVVILGDSLSAGYGLKTGEGWVSLLTQRVQEKKLPWRIINSSISGDTTGNGLLRLPSVLAQHKPAIVIIELGGNDGLRGTPPALIRANLKQLTALAQQADAQVYLMEMRLPPNFGRAYIDAYVANYASVAQEMKATLIPFFLRDVGGKNELMQADGIHPNAKGQPMMLDRVWQVLPIDKRH